MKYEITSNTKVLEDGRVLHQIRALRDFSDIKEGELGGWIENEYNLSQDGDCWLYNQAMVYKNGRVSGNAQVCNSSEVFDNAIVRGNAFIGHASLIYDDAIVTDNVNVLGSSEIFGKTVLQDDVDVEDGIIDGGNFTGQTDVYKNIIKYY